AIDRNGDGVITESDELFGPKTGTNGFEALKKLDFNGDGVIDKEDPAFAKLLLWRDVNGNGKSEKSELFTLEQMGVESLNLHYDSKSMVPVPGRAELREKSFFTYRNKRTGKLAKGDVIDVWFAPKAPKAPNGETFAMKPTENLDPWLKP